MRCSSGTCTARSETDDLIAAALDYARRARGLVHQARGGELAGMWAQHEDLRRRNVLRALEPLALATVESRRRVPLHADGGDGRER